MTDMVLAPATVVAITDSSNLISAPCEDYDSLGNNINNDSYFDVYVLDVKKFSYCLIQLYNAHASNGITWSIYGSSKYNSSNGKPLAYDGSWFPLKTDQSLPALTAAAENLSDKYKFILIRAKRTAAGNSGTLDINVCAVRT